MPLELKERYISNDHNKHKKLNWRKADKLAIYKPDRGVELESAEKELQLKGQNRTCTYDLRISSQTT